LRRLKEPTVRAVIDSNSLRSSDLEEYLKYDNKHCAVLTDYTWMEIYKGDEKIALLESLAILKDFPDQVILLKGTAKNAVIKPRPAGMADAMIYSKSEGSFQDSLSMIDEVSRGTNRALLSIKEHGQYAKEHLGKFASAKTELEEYLNVAQHIYGQENLDKLRGKKKSDFESTGAFLDVVDKMYVSFCKRHPTCNRINHGKWIPYSYIYRYSLAMNLLILRYLRQGNNFPRSDKKFVNDFSDVLFAVYATFFNGLMTSDKRLNNLYLELSVILDKLGVRQPRHYIEIWQEKLDPESSSG